MKEVKKKNSALIVAIVLTLVLVAGASYAWLKLTKTSTVINKIKAGSLEMVLDDEASTGIKLLNTVPMSYRQGMAATDNEYTFTLENKGTTDNNFTIYLNDINTYTTDNGDQETIASGQKLGDNHIRFILLKDGEEAIASNSKLLSQDPGRAIDTGVIKSGQKINYKLKLWIDSKAGDNSTESEIMGKKFNAGLTVEASQVIGG